MCGFEEYTHVPEAMEFRPTPSFRINGTSPPFFGEGEAQGLTSRDSAILGGLCSLVFYCIPTVVLIGGDLVVDLGGKQSWILGDRSKQCV